MSGPGGVEISVPFPSADERVSFGLGLRREWLDHILLRRAEQEGTMVLQGFQAREVGFEQGKWTIRWNNETCDPVSATILVGADGRNSWVVERLQIESRRGTAKDQVAFQLHLAGVQEIGNEVQVHLFPGGYAGLIGLGNTTANLCFTVDKNHLRNSGSIEGLLEKNLFQNERLKAALDRAERIGEVYSAYPVFFSPRNPYGDGFVLVGDAARVTEPVTGEGVYFALKGGELAAQAIDQAFARGDFSARALSLYGRSAKKVFAFRAGLNRLIRALVYRPSLAWALIGLSSRTSLPIVPMVRLLCRQNSTN
jgi:flavin-dependent dehydrogenase